MLSGNGYIEGKELQNFIKELQQARKQAGLVSQTVFFLIYCCMVISDRRQGFMRHIPRRVEYIDTI